MGEVHGAEKIAVLGEMSPALWAPGLPSALDRARVCAPVIHETLSCMSAAKLLHLRS